ncbi:MAG TPA: class I SAM-dependent methyltransferase [Candidatus Nanopelagicales bacterium]|nr:class I SAM-dependent methyltransferase [Candidatus Nanopelagicales bacterium]
MTDDAADRLLGGLDRVYGLNAAAERLAVVEVAARTGTLLRCAAPVSRADVEAALPWGGTVPARFVDALLAHGVLEAADAGLVACAEWSEFAVPDGERLLLDALGHGQARTALVRALGTGEDYWSTDPRTQLQLARGVTFDPRSDVALAVRRSAAERIPTVADALREGRRYLELGCGVGGALLAQLRLHPHLEGVGVELSDVLAAEARASAVELGLDDRCRIVTGDATRFRDDDEFDVCFWSQFFFPRPSRAGALATASACLREGGVLLAPAPDVAEIRPPYDDEARDAAVDSLLWTTWGVPTTSSEQVADEMRAAGFVDVEVVPGFVPVAVGRAPARNGQVAAQTPP